MKRKSPCTQQSHSPSPRSAKTSPYLSNHREITSLSQKSFRSLSIRRNQLPVQSFKLRRNCKFYWGFSFHLHFYSRMTLHLQISDFVHIFSRFFMCPIVLRIRFNICFAERGEWEWGWCVSGDFRFMSFTIFFLYNSLIFFLILFFFLYFFLPTTHDPRPTTHDPRPTTHTHDPRSLLTTHGRRHLATLDIYLTSRRPHFRPKRGYAMDGLAQFLQKPKDTNISFSTSWNEKLLTRNIGKTGSSAFMANKRWRRNKSKRVIYLDDA